MGSRHSSREKSLDCEIPGWDLLLNVSICKCLSQMRRRKGWSLQRLSNETGITRDLLQDIEKGTLEIDLPRLSKICRCLQTDIGQVLEQAQTIQSQSWASISRASLT
jgi:DNA-binding Xre family transcriptional regulator